MWLVQLASLSDPDVLPRVLSSVLDLELDRERPVIDQVVDRLRGGRALMILDNCEHLVTSTRAVILPLLANCPELQIVATSRTRLGIVGEMVLTVEPLSHPPNDSVTTDDLAAFEAVQLFVERARFRRPTFDLTDRTAPGIQRICTLVEGIPLALELAAARVGALGVDEIADRLARSVRLLTAEEGGTEERHRSLTRTLDWSYDLLDLDEQELFRRLSVFHGGWTAEDAEQLVDVGGDGIVLELLSRLVDRSLVAVEDAWQGVVWYRFLEPVRQYAGERLRDAGEEDETRRRHAELCMRFAREAAEGMRGHQASLWFKRIGAYHDNLRAALRWSLEVREAHVGLSIAAGLWRFWYGRGFFKEGRGYLRQLLTMGGNCPEIDATVRGAAYNAAGAMAFYQTDLEEALTYYQHALRLRREVGDEPGAAATLSNIGLVLKGRGEYSRAAQYFEEARALQEALGERRGLCSTLGNLGILYQETGDFERARPFLEESVVLSRDLGDNPMTSLNNLAALEIEQRNFGRAQKLLEESLALSTELGVRHSQYVALNNLGRVALALGDPAQALDRQREALLIVRDQGDALPVAGALEGIADAMAEIGDARLAAVLLEVASRLRGRTGARLPPVEQDHLEALRARLRDRLGPEFVPASREAASLTVDEAVTLALGEGIAAGERETWAGKRG